MNHNADQATIYSTGLALSTNTWVEQVTTDIPFLALGITALAALTCLLLTQRLTFPASCILASAFLAFNGAIFDFARLLQEAKSTTNSSTFAILVLREVNFSLSIALNYLYFLAFLGRPPRGELKLCAIADQPRARRESPSRWGYWGIFGYLVQAALGASIVAVAVLEIIWRVSGNAGSAIYMVNGIIQGVLSVAFLGKVFLNTYLSPLSPRWKTARDYLPVTLSICARLAIILVSEFTIGFTESSLGRLLQAIELYALMVFSLVSPYYGERVELVEKPVSKRASSFRGLRFSNAPRWSALNSAPPDANGMTTEKNIPTDSNMPRRPSPTQRLSSWLNNRLVAKRDPQEDRLWNKDQPDLEAPQTPGDRIPEDDPSPIQAKYSDKPLTATWQGPYINTQNTTETSTSDAFPPFSSTNGTNLTTPISAPPKAAAGAPSGTGALGIRPTSILPTGKFIGQFEVRRSFESGSDSPIYGINGIVQRDNKRQSLQLSRRSTFNNDSDAIYQLQKEQAQLERSMASMAAFSPSRESYAVKNPATTTTTEDAGFGRARLSEPGGNQFTASFLSAGPSESFKSDFSLRDFPSPPGSVYKGGSTRQAPPSPEKVIMGTKDLNPQKPKESVSNERPNATETVEDVQFAMVPPRAAFQRRRASFPVIVRESATSSMDAMSRIISTYAESEDDIGGKRVRMSGVNNRLDVTSFIGELTTPPEVTKGFVPRRSNLRNRSDSLDSRLSPLPEDVSSPRPSVEIIDMRGKSTTFSPAIAITTGEKSPFLTTEAPRKVSFAPVTYDASGRPRPQPPMLKTPQNTLPSSPRPSGNSPLASPNRSVLFKPVTSSPLASPGSGMSPTSRGAPGLIPMARSKPTYPGYTKGLKPTISGPFPLGSVKESDTKQTRRNPPPRF